MQPLGSSRPPRHDPSPSRLAYRLNRLWLRPGFRRLVRLGGPVLILGLVGAVVFGSADRRVALRQHMAQIVENLKHRPEFMLYSLEIRGASSELAQALRASMVQTLPVSSWDLDLEALRSKLQGFDAVARAEIIVRGEGVLDVEIEQRRPALVWRNEQGLDLIDPDGRRVAGIAARGDRPDLPLIAGTGANFAAPEALRLLGVAQPLAPRLRGLVRVGERRWDLVLDRDQRILLPEENPQAALEWVLAQDRAQGLLRRDLVLIDMRTPRRPTVRLAPPPADPQKTALLTQAKAGAPTR